MPTLRHFFVALQFLTVLPTPSFTSFSAHDEEKALHWHPVVGALVGIIDSGVFLLLYFISHDMRLSVLFAMLTDVCITGAFHHDALADAADALFSSKADRETKLLIMKDSRIGTMGSLALIFYILLKWQLLSSLPFQLIWKTLLLEPILGKFFVHIAMKHLPYISINSKMLTRFTNVISQRWYIFAHLCIITFSVAMYPLYIALSVITTMYIGAILYIRWIKKDLGGATGDIYGTLQELTGLFIIFACYLATHVSFQ